MFGLVRTAVRFFFVGFAAGVLLSPRSGQETRRLIREKIELVVSSVLEVADLPPVEGAGAATAKPDAPRRARGRSESGAAPKS